MTEWEVLGVLVALVGFVTAIVTPIIKLNTTVTKLTVLVDTLGANLAELTSRNTDAHSEITRKLDDHEKRIIHLEEKA